MRRALVVTAGVFLGALGLAALFYAISPSQGDWLVDTQKDAMTDEPSADAIILSSDGAARLALSCTHRKPEPVVVIQTQQRMSGLQPDQNNIDRSFIYRLDSSEPVTTIATLADDLIGFGERRDGIRRDAAITAGIADANRLGVQVTDWKGEDHQWVFNVSGAGRALTMVQRHCAG